MFLDDELLEICKNDDCSEAVDIQQLNVDLCAKCETYYKAKIYPNISKKEAKAVIDRTFNLLDSFTRMAIKEGGRMSLLGELFQTHTFKKQLLSNDEMARIYGILQACW
jgi:hypothetical protein